MAQKVLLKDANKNEILPITRGELVLDSSGNPAFHSNEFLATTSQPGLMSKEDKYKIDNISISTLEITDLLPNGKKIATVSVGSTSYNILAPASYNWDEIIDKPTKLSQFTDDVVAGKYLPITGGTLTGTTSIPLYIKSSHATEAAIGLGANNANGYGYIVYKGGDSWAVTKEQWGAEYSILHSGNYSNFALPLSGGTINGSITLNNPTSDTLFEGAITLDAKSYGSESYSQIRFKNGSNVSSRYGFINLKGSAYGHGSGVEIGRSNDDSTTIWASIDASGITATSFIGNLTGNADSATKLQTPRKLWGQSFDGTGDVSGTFRQLYTGSYDGAVAHSILCNINEPYGLITRINGNGNVLQQAQRENTNTEWFNFILQPFGGNVGIGTTSPTEKLDVAGNVKANSFIGNASSADSANKLNAEYLADLNNATPWRFFDMNTGYGSTDGNKPNIAWVSGITGTVAGSRNYRWQLAMTTGSQNPYFRQEANGNWNNWSTLAFTSNIPTRLSQLTDDVVAGKYLPLSGGTITGDLSLNKYLRINAWSGYGSGSANIWYDGTIKQLKCDDVANISLQYGEMVIHSGNYNSYAPKLDGTGATGTWGINISGSSGSSKTSTQTNYLKILDIRDAKRNPNSDTYSNYSVTAWFSDLETPIADWHSGLTVKGWHAGYTVWQLCSYSSTGTANDYNLYFRNGNNDTWGSWKTILDSSNYSSTLDNRYYTETEVNTLLGNYYPITGGNMSGDNRWIGSTMGGGTDYWRIGGYGSSDNGTCIITIGDNSNDKFAVEIADYSGTTYRPLEVSYNSISTTSVAVSGLVSITGNGNTMTLGSQNGSWGHIENSANIPFYFNRGIHVDGDIRIYSKNYGLSKDGYLNVFGTEIIDNLLLGGSLRFKTSSPGTIGKQYSDTDTNMYNYIKINEATGGIQYYSGSWTSGDHSAHQFITSNSNTPRLTIRNTTGYVGIGTDSPIHKLHVDGAGVFKNTGSTTYTTDGITIGAGDVAQRYITCYGKTGISYFNIGYAASSRNSAELLFSYSSSGSGSNYAGLSLYGGENTIFVYPTYTKSTKYINAPGFVHPSYWSSAYALTSDGGVAHIGSMSVNYATSAGNADTVDSYHASSFYVQGRGTVNAQVDLQTIPKDTSGGWMVTNSGWTGMVAVLGQGHAASNRAIGFLFKGGQSSRVNLLTQVDNTWGDRGVIAYTSDIPTSLPANGGNADTVDGYHASGLVKFYLSPMATNAPADSAKSWFVNTMPAASGAIVYNVPGSEKTIIAGKSSGSHGHMLQLNYDNTYLRILRYYSGTWKSTDWEKISAGYADSAGNADTVDGYHASSFFYYKGGLSSASSAVSGVGLYGWATSSGGFGETYGDSIVFQGYSSWYRRLDFGTSGRIRFWQGINTTTMSNVGTLAYTFDIPTKTSQLTNDSGFVTGGPYLPLAGGAMSSGARISSSGGSLYLGNSNNAGWVCVQDLCSQSGSSYWNITQAGAATFSGNMKAAAYFEDSDERLKNFIRDVEVDLYKIKELPKKYFVWKKDVSTFHIGTSAQAVQKLYPELVSSSTDGYLSVDYSKLSVIALKGIDELYDMILELRAENRQLREQIRQMQK